MIFFFISLLESQPVSQWNNQAKSRSNHVLKANLFLTTFLDQNLSGPKNIIYVKLVSNITYYIGLVVTWKLVTVMAIEPFTWQPCRVNLKSSKIFWRRAPTSMSKTTKAKLLCMLPSLKDSKKSSKFFWKMEPIHLLKYDYLFNSLCSTTRTLHCLP